MPEVLSDPTVTDAYAKKLAVLILTGNNYTQCAKALSVGNAQVAKLLRTPQYKAAVRHLGDEAMADAIAMCRSEMKALMKKALEVFHQKLEEGNLNAAIKVMEISGMMEVNTDRKESGGLTIVMPGSTAPIEKSIPSEVVNTDDMLPL